MRCPVCRAEVEQGPQCRRCRADLSLLFALEEQRRATLGSAYRRLMQGDLDGALCLAKEVDGLRRDEESGRLLTLVHLRRRDFAAAWRCYNSCRTELGTQA
jgi:hypothetical protein